jgi:2-methylcitrate dehydratase PrpD
VRVDAPRGSPENPASDQELAEKFARLSAGRISPDRCEVLAKAMAALDEAADVATIPWGSDPMIAQELDEDD